MTSKDKEYVPFYDIFNISGAVENYLCDLEKQMQNTLRDILEHAKGTADDWEIGKKRHDWLEDYCAQIALLTT
jgi:dynein heavy chain